mgnify:CR=1 FL=1
MENIRTGYKYSFVFTKIDLFMAQFRKNLKMTDLPDFQCKIFNSRFWRQNILEGFIVWLSKRANHLIWPSDLTSKIWPLNMINKFHHQIWPSNLTDKFDEKFGHYIWPPNLTSKLDHQTWLPNLTTKLDHQIWLPNLTTKFDHQIWPPNLTTKFYHQTWPAYLTIKLDHQIWQLNCNIKSQFARNIFFKMLLFYFWVKLLFPRQSRFVNFWILSKKNKN